MTVVKLIATGLGSGYSPFAPGTAGTLGGIPLYLALSSLSWPLYLASVSVLTLLAVYASDEGERIFDKKDSPRIVIDEIVGLLWSLALVGPTAGRIGFVAETERQVIEHLESHLHENGLPEDWFNSESFLLPKYRPGGGSHELFRAWRREFRRRRWVEFHRQRRLRSWYRRVRGLSTLLYLGCVGLAVIFILPRLEERLGRVWGNVTFALLFLVVAPIVLTVFPMLKWRFPWLEE